MTRPSNLATAEDVAQLMGQLQPVRRRAHPERRFTDGIKRYARRGGWLVYHPLRSQGSDPGFLDLCLLRAPRLVVAELKVPPNVKPSDWQEVWLAGWRTLGLLAGPHLSIETYVWLPEDEPTILEILA